MPDTNIVYTITYYNQSGWHAYPVTESYTNNESQYYKRLGEEYVNYGSSLHGPPPSGSVTPPPPTGSNPPYIPNTGTVPYYPNH